MAVVKSTTVRDSGIELMRLIAIFSVLMYHFISFYTISYSPDNQFGYAFWMPFRTAVTLFVFISGFYRIHFSLQGFLRLVIKTFVLYAPFEIIRSILAGGGAKELVTSLLPISRGPYWYILTYLCLYLFSPVINKYLNDCTLKQRMFLIGALSIISIYFGIVSVDASLFDGKNLAHFVLLYTIGDTIANYKNEINKVKTSWLVLLFLVMNISQIVFFALYRPIPALLWFIFDCNNGIILMINAIITFVLFLRIQFKNNFVNSLATSVIVIYIIQQEPFVHEHLSSFFSGMWEVPVLYSCHGLIETLVLVGYLACKAIFYIIVGIAIDKLLTPLWIVINKQLECLPTLNYEQNK